MRTVPELAPNHPLRGWKSRPEADCIADAAPPWLLDDVAAFYHYREPADTDLAELEREALLTLTLRAPTAEALRAATLNSQGLVDFTGAPHGGAHKLLPEWQSQPPIIPTTIIDHTIVGVALGTYYYFRDRTGIESHFIVAGKWGTVRDGAIWQLMSIDRQADANLEANRYAISIETEDDGSPEDTPWTAAQMESLRWLHHYLARARGTIRRQKVTSCASGGLGYHAIWPTPSCWTPSRGKTCPAGPRIRQWGDDLLPAFVGGEPEPPKEWWQVSIPSTELGKIRDQAAVPALEGTRGQAAIRSAVGGIAADILKAVGTSLVFVRQLGTPQVYALMGGQLIHMTSGEMLAAYAGSDAFSKVVVLAKEAPIWQLPTNGQQPGQGTLAVGIPEAVEAAKQERA